MQYNKANPEIKFAGGDQALFFNTLRQRVDEYFTTHNLSPNANGAMILKTIVLFMGYILPFVALLVFQPPFWIALLVWAFVGVSMAGIGMSVMHDANHGAYSSNKKVNQWMSYSLNLLGGTGMNWKMQHNVLHHTYTNISGLDEDIDAKLVLRLSPHSEKKPIHKYQWFYAFFLYSLLTLYWGLAKDFVQYRQYKRVGMNRQKQHENRSWLFRVTIIKLIYFFVFIGLPILCGIKTYQVIIGFLLMHAVAGVILSTVFQLAHTVEETVFPLPDAEGKMENSWAIHQMKTTMDFSRRNKLLSWYVGGLNFQVEHHLFTRICHVHYPAISEIVKKTAKEFDVPYLEKTTLVEAFKSHVRLLRLRGVPSLNEIGG